MTTQQSRQYHVILRDELGKEFSVTLRAFDTDHAIESIRFDYPESNIVAITTLPLEGAPPPL